MNPQDPLAALNPLREPVAIGWWPPAPGWWALLVLGVVALAALCYFLWRRHRRNAYRRRALRQLEALCAGQRASRDDRRFARELNALLKSVALRAYPAREVASRHGASWRAFLNEGLPAAEQFTADFDEAVYRETPPGIDTERLQRSAQYWIRHHKVAA
jgi:hypothetical protein